MQKLPLRVNLKLDIHGVGGKMCQNPSKTHTFQFWGHFWGVRTQFFFSKVSKMKLYEHFEWVQPQQDICQDVLASKGAKTWIIRASDIELDFWGHFWGVRRVNCPQKVHFQNCLSISDGYNDLKMFLSK